MSRTPGTQRWLLPWMALVPLLSSCQSPAQDVLISPKSSLLAVEVLYPFPRSRDPILVQAFFVRGPIHAGLKELPELIPASFVKRSRAYLLDPEPGTYSLVAVTSAVSPPWNEYPVAGGVTKTTWSGAIAHAWVFPAELIHQTRTTIGPGGVAFMGALRIGQGERIDADVVFRDNLQERIAERIRPGVTSESGVAGWFTRTWMVDLDQTSLSEGAADRESFFDDALKDMGASAWAGVIARAASREAALASSATPAPSPKSTAKSTAPIPEPASSTTLAPSPKSTPPIPEAVAPKPESVAPKPQSAAPAPQAAPPAPEASPPSPERRRIPGLPPGSALAEIELGMSHQDVRGILGDPDDRIDRLTAKAWIPFYTGAGVRLVDWIYAGEGRVVFSLNDGSLEVLDVVYDPDEGK